MNSKPTLDPISGSQPETIAWGHQRWLWSLARHNQFKVLLNVKESVPVGMLEEAA